MSRSRQRACASKRCTPVGGFITSSPRAHPFLFLVWLTVHSFLALVQFPQGVPLVKTSHLTFLLRQGMHALGALRLIISVDRFLGSYASPDRVKHHLPAKDSCILLDAASGDRNCIA